MRKAKHPLWTTPPGESIVVNRIKLNACRVHMSKMRGQGAKFYVEHLPGAQSRITVTKQVDGYAS